MSEGIERSKGFVKATKLWLRAGLDYTDSKAYDVQDVKAPLGGVMCTFDTLFLVITLNVDDTWHLGVYNTNTGSIDYHNELDDEEIVKVFRNAKTNLDITKKSLLKLLEMDFGSKKESANSDKPF